MRTQPSPALLLGVAFALVAGVGGGTAWLLSSGARDGEPGGAAPGAAPALLPTQAAAGELVAPAARVEEGAADAPEAPTLVLWPLEVELECLRVERLPELPDGTRVRSGHAAALAGRFVDGNGNPVAATVSFVAGPNEGRVLYAGASGEFGANDLLPGIDVVEVRGPGIIGSRREVRLRRRSEQLLNIGFGRLAALFGDVVDDAGEPIAGARVTVDGQRADTDLEGRFYVAGVASGAVLVEVEHEHYVAQRSELNVSAGRTYAPGQIRFRLERPASLQVTIPQAIGGAGPAYVYVLPSNTRVQRTFPWYKISPLRVQPGTSALIEGLPATLVTLYVFHEGALASPQAKSINLRPDTLHTAEIHLQPAKSIYGTVVQNGAPVARATVRLEAPDQVSATLAFFRETQLFLESEVLPPLPPACQTVATDADGRFVLTAWSELSPVRYLEAQGPDGQGFAARLVGAEVSEVVLALGPPPVGTSELLLLTSRRHQGLPIELSVNGAPRAPFVLPYFRELLVDGLEAGTWRAHATWRGHEVLPDEVFELDHRAELRCELPAEAIEGQDAETWRRAGREYPR